MYSKGKRTKDGYRSKFEQAVASALKKLRIKFTYESEKLPYVLEKTYTGDFFIKDAILEVKGFLTPLDREKLLAVKQQHPDKRIILVLMAPKQKLPNAKMKHFEWCEKNNFLWCSIDTLEETLNEL